MVGMECPSREDLTAYLSGGLSDQRAESLSEHLETCAKCKAQLETLTSAGDPLIAALRRRPVANVHEREPQLQAVIARAKALGAHPAEGPARPDPPPAAKPPAGGAGEPAKPAAYDPYYRWLGIPPHEQPPSHYRLLGVTVFEADSEVIADAADRQTAHLRTFQIGKYSELSQRLLNEVAKAKICLLDPSKKAVYDAKLKQQLQPAQAVPPSAPPATPPPKNQLGEYQLLAKLGSGGMGTVYKARHTKLEKTVALKVLAKSSLVNDEAVARFDREMKAVGQLNHPNIVQAHDAREIAGTRFLVMEYVDGLDLAKLVDACGPLPVADACELVRQTALGLDHAHQHGLVHRDIKPANLMLSFPLAPGGRGVGGEGDQPQVKILDLGLAMFQPGQLAGVERITASGQAMGTVDYMAPEQALASRDVDIRADLYSLGCTLYKLLSGRAPFSGPKYQDQVNKLIAHARHPVPPIRKLRPDVPAQVAAVLDRLLAKDPAQRYATPAELVEAIAPLAGGSNLRELMARARKSSAAAAAPAGDPAAADASRAHIETFSNVASQAQSITNGGLPVKGGAISQLRAFILHPSSFIPSNVPGWAVAAAGGGAALMLLAIVLYISTNHGLVKIEISDPKAKVEVKVDGETITIAAIQELLTLRVGDHALEVVSDRFATATQSFTVRRGELAVVRVTLEPKGEGRIAKAEGGNEPRATAGSSSSVVGTTGGQAASGTQSPIPPLAIAPFDAAQAKQHQENWAKYLGVPVEMTNSIGMKLTLIPPGEFDMGSTDEEVTLVAEHWKAMDHGPHVSPGLKIDRTETPRHRVGITKPFYMGAYHVTQAEYENVMGVNPSAFTEKQADTSAFEPPLSDGQKKGRAGAAGKMAGKETSRYPVDYVNWDGATEFCRRLSAMPTERAARRAYRLPTEAEWEYSCRAGTTTRWSFGDDEAGMRESTWNLYNADWTTHPVGEKKPNAWGLSEMHGNLYQWCADWFSADYYSQSPQNDPTGPAVGSARVLRGGCFGNSAYNCRSAYRHGAPPARYDAADGFRVVEEVGGQAAGSTTGVTPVPNPQSPVPPPAVVLPDGKTKITFRPELSMKPLGHGEQRGDLLPQMTDDPCGPFSEEPVYFDPSTARNVVYDIQSDRPVEEVLFRCAGAKGMHMEVLDLEGKILSQVGPIEGGGPWDAFYLLIPGGAPAKFRLRLHNDASQWFFIAALRLRSRDAAGNISDSARQTPIPDPQSPIPVSFEQAEELQQTAAKRVGAAVQWSNSTGMKFALVPRGRFGDQELEEPYYLGIYKVTQEEYERITGTNPSAYSATGDKKEEVAGKDTRRYPVENICWIDAAEFCNRLSEKEGLKPYYRIDGDTVRVTGARSYCLPCRTARCFAAYAAEREHAVVDGSLADEYSWAGWDNGPPHPVGVKKATAFGLYDMFGNGSEDVLALGMGQFFRGGLSLQSLHAHLPFPVPPWGHIDWLNGVGPRGRFPGTGLRVMRVLDQQLAPALPADGDDKAERAVAEWALGLGRGGRLSLRLDGNEWGISNRDEFPQERLRVARLDLNGVAITNSDLDRLRVLKGLREFVCDLPQLGDAGMARLSMLPSLRNLFLGGVRLTDVGLAHLARLPHIRKLDVGSQLLSDAGVSSVGKMVTLEELRLNHGVNITDAALPHLGKLVALKKLDVGESKVTGDGLKYLANRRSLEELGVSGTRFSDQGAGLLQQFPAIRVLDVRDTSCSDQALLHIGQLTHLRVLWLGGTQVTGDGLKHLAKLTSLEELTLFRTRFSDQGAENLEQFPALRALNVSITPCSDQAMPHIGQLKHLRWLCLGGTQVTSVGLRQLANLGELEELILNPIPHFDSREAALTGLTRLRKLDLNGTHVEDDQLAELPRWKGLRELILARTGITDAGLDTLTKITTLEHLDLGGTTVTAAGVVRLHAALPRCKISGAPTPAKN